MIAVLALRKEQVYFGNTVIIDKLNIERNLKPRRNLTVEKCVFRDCNESGIAKGKWREKKMLPLCEIHLQIAKSKPGEWRIIPDT